MANKPIYRSLNKGLEEIRRLHVFGSTTSESIVTARLETVSLLGAHKPYYKAISYCWGEVQGRAQIMLNGLLFEAPASAVKVLRRFRPSQPSRCKVLWIDTICINQDDIEERGQQVELMGQVFRSCSEVMIWLGDWRSSALLAFASIKVMLDVIQARQGDDAFTTALWRTESSSDGREDLSKLSAQGFDGKALDRFLSRPRFHRLWASP